MHLKLNKTMMTLAVTLAVAVPSFALACDGVQHADTKSVRTITVAELASSSKDKKAVPVDVNGKELRSSHGVIPGAVLLTSASLFDASKELPKDKATNLVFYCANTMCTASESAARRAIDAGYTNVAVLPDGIIGWKQAGQPTAKPNNS